MTTSVDYSKFARSVLHGMRHNEHVDRSLSKDIERLLFNVTSLTATIALLDGSKKINAHHVEVASAYVKHSCDRHKHSNHSNHKVGGQALGSAEWSGENSGAYSVMSPQADQAIDFGAAVARPEMGQSGGSASEIVPLTAISVVIKSHPMEITGRARTMLRNLINSRLSCLQHDLKEAEGRSGLTAPKLKKVLALKRHAIFH